jgi:hypothetical protein
VTAVVDFNSSTQPDLKMDGINLYPNPTTGDIKLQVPGIGKVDLSVFSLDGQKIFEQNYQEANGQTISINAQSLNPGIYLVRLVQGQKSYLGKFCKA